MSLKTEPIIKLYN